MSWFRVDSDLVDHPKVFRLAERLNDPCAGWYYIRLLSWTSRYSARGRPRDVTRPAIEHACGWRGTPGALIQAFVSVGLVDELENQDDGATLEVHDWWEIQRQYVIKAEKDAERKRRERSRGVGYVRVTSADSHAENLRGVPRDGARTIRDETRRSKALAHVARATAQVIEINQPPLPLKVPQIVSEGLLGPDPCPDPPKPLSPTRCASEALTKAYFEEVGSQYAWQGAKDESALAWLLKRAQLPEILERWRRGLTSVGWHEVRGVAQLKGKWNDLAPPRASAPGIGGRPPATETCAACGDPAPTGWPDLGVPTCHAHAEMATEWAEAHGVHVWERGGADAWLEEFRK